METKANLKDKQRYTRGHYSTYTLSNKKYYETHKKEILAYAKNYMHKYYETHKEQFRQRSRDYYNKHFRALYSYPISTQKRFFNRVWKEVKSGNKET